jgi:hypothetical protein
MTKKAKIAWKRSNEGFVDSKDGKWSISPLYCGGTRPQFFELSYERRTITRLASSQRDAKDEAEGWLEEHAPELDREPVKRTGLDWDTVELVRRDSPIHADRRGRSVVKMILSGAAAKARARGAIYTHVQLRQLIPAGLETLAYGVGLLMAAVESERDFVRGVEVAARAICEASERFERAGGSSRRAAVG